RSKPLNFVPKFTTCLRTLATKFKIYFPAPFHFQQPPLTHYAAPYIATPAVQLPPPPVIGPVPPPAAAYAVPQSGTILNCLFANPNNQIVGFILLHSLFLSECRRHRHSQQ
ncbi:RNA-binding protein 42-like, partial [Trifolium pratense]